MHVNALEMRRTGSSKLLESTCVLRVTLLAHRRHLDRSLCYFCHRRSTPLVGQFRLQLPIERSWTHASNS